MRKYILKYRLWNFGYSVCFALSSVALEQISLSQMESYHDLKWGDIICLEQQTTLGVGRVEPATSPKELFWQFSVTDFRSIIESGLRVRSDDISSSTPCDNRTAAREHVENMKGVAMGLLPDTQNCGCACAGNAGNVSLVTAGKRSRHALRHVRHERAVMHAGIAN